MKIGFVLGLFGFVALIFSLILALIGFELGLFFGFIIVFGRKMGKIGFVLHNLLINSYVSLRRIYIAQTRNPNIEIRNKFKI
jgi:hypothetical protein